MNENWTHCKACYIRRNHVYDSEMEAWRCGFCGVVNDELTQLRKNLPIASLTSFPRRSVIDVAESYLEKNPEEE